MFNRSLASRRLFVLLVSSIVAVTISAITASAQTTAFTYQGRLTDGANPANGAFDMEFRLFDLATVGTGNQQGPTVTRLNVMVTAGTFSVQLDFGVCTVCFPGAKRYLEISVKPAGDPAFTTLSPRQQILSAPYSLKSANATAADSLSSLCINCVTSSQIASVNGSAVTGTIPASSVPPGSDNYIQNTTAPQAASNFNITGNGVVGGTLGIGTSNPAGALHVKGTSPVRILGDTSTLSGSEYVDFMASHPFSLDGSLDLGGMRIQRHAATGNIDTLFFAAPNGDSASEKMRVTSNGNVGIGTTSPAGSLHVKGASPVRILGDTSTLSGSEYVDFMARSSIFSSDLGGVRIRRQAGTGNVDTLILAAPSGGSASEKMRVRGDGNVGIGTNNPFARLTVQGPGTDILSPALWVNNSNGDAGLVVFGNRTVAIGALDGFSTFPICYNAPTLAACSSAAEYVPTIDSGLGPPETADVVSLVSNVRNPYDDEHAPFVVAKSTRPCDENLLGFIVNPQSGAGGKKLNEHYLPLAVYGYFPAKVTTENGMIRRGDPLTSSSKAGYAMKATQACKIIGFALEDTDREGKIQVFAHLSEYTAPQVAALQAQVEQLRRENTAREARLAAVEQSVRQLMGQEQNQAPPIKRE